MKDLGIWSNRALIVCALAWLLAQAAKIVLTLALERRLDWKRMFGLGGMPSSHSAVVCALATCAGLMEGFDGLAFAVCAVLAAVVMTDAAGVRQAAGKQAKLLNEIVQDMIESGRGLTPETLKELLGHTPLEVAVGAVLGVALALIIM